MVVVEFELDEEFEIEDSLVYQFLKVLGELIINRVKVKVRQMGLVGPPGVGGAYLQGWFFTVKGRQLILENTQEYAVYLEYGTYNYWNQYGADSFPDTMALKKKDLPKSVSKNLFKGMQPFAPVRRVIYSEQEMIPLLQEAASQFV